MANQHTSKLADWKQIIIKERISTPDTSIIQFSRDLKKKYKDMAKYSVDHIRAYVGNLMKDEKDLQKVADAKNGNGVAKKVLTEIEQEEERIKEGIKKKIKKPTTIMNLANVFNVAPKKINKLLEELKQENYNVRLTDHTAEMIPEVAVGGNHRIDLRAFDNKTYKIGFITDDHLCNKAERLDVLNAVFDVFEEEGITEVYNAGNWIDGEFRFNKLDIHTHGMDNQLQYFIDNYPQRDGITINYIAGDDHEGWYQQKTGIIIGKHLYQMAKEQGRNDLNYLGYMESDIELKAEKGKALLRVTHAGGGTAYALSYQPQKLIESLTGGDKPHILLIGHYHKAEVLPSYRNVRAVQGGCGCDQTRFMRKKRIEAHVGAWVIEFQQAKDGSINRFKTEWLGFFDQAFYKAKKYYINDAK